VINPFVYYININFNTVCKTRECYTHICGEYLVPIMMHFRLNTITELCWLLFINLIYIKLRDCSLQRF
jgi:hypothetical protein